MARPSSVRQRASALWVTGAALSYLHGKGMNNCHWISHPCDLGLEGPRICVNYSYTSLQVLPKTTLTLLADCYSFRPKTYGNSDNMDCAKLEDSIRDNGGMKWIGSRLHVNISAERSA
jgi:hypothetical protein